ncbi:hypothetical protein, partial [Microbacterium sp.]|uniref:hypothetical protein n=1 Tax=Microbacterium sp. TaxID=51671 RepID=UPI003F9BDF5E
AALFGHLVEQGAALIGAAAAGAAGIAGAGSSGATGGSSSGGGLLTVAGVATAGVASLAIAGVVAAAAVLPGYLSPPAEGTQSALQDSTSPTGAEIEPDADLAEASDESDGSKTPKPEPTPEKPSPTPKATETPAEPAPTPTRDDSPEATSSGDETPTPEPTTEPTPDPPGNEDTGDGDNGNEDTGNEDTGDNGEDTGGDGDGDDGDGDEEPGDDDQVQLSEDVDSSKWMGNSPTFELAANATPGENVHFRVVNNSDDAIGQAICSVLDPFLTDACAVEGTETAEENGLAIAELDKKPWMSHEDTVTITLVDDPQSVIVLTLEDFFPDADFPQLDED